MKKIISLITAAVGLIMMLCACTPSGMPTSLVGVWKTESERYRESRHWNESTLEYEYTYDLTTDVSYIEFTDDDYMIQSSTKDGLAKTKKDKKQCQQIVKATCSELYIKSGTQVSDDSLMIYQYELIGNTLTLKMASYSVTVFTKDE